MFCLYCGAEKDDDGKCPNCGRWPEAEKYPSLRNDLDLALYGLYLNSFGLREKEVVR